MSVNLDSILGFGDDTADMSDFSCVKPSFSMDRRSSRDEENAVHFNRSDHPLSASVPNLQFTPGKSRLSQESVNALRAKFQHVDDLCDNVAKKPVVSPKARRPLATRSVNAGGNPVTEEPAQLPVGQPVEQPAAIVSPPPRKIRFADEDDVLHLHTLETARTPPPSMATSYAGVTPGPKAKTDASIMAVALQDFTPADALFSPATVPAGKSLPTSMAEAEAPHTLTRTIATGAAPMMGAEAATYGYNGGVSLTLPAYMHGRSGAMADGIARGRPRARGAGTGAGAGALVEAVPTFRATTPAFVPPAAEVPVDMGDLSVDDASVSLSKEQSSSLSIEGEGEETLTSLADLVDLDALASSNRHSVLHPHKVAMQRGKRDMASAACYEGPPVDEPEHEEEYKEYHPAYDQEFDQDYYEQQENDQSVMTMDSQASCASDYMTAATTLSIDHDFAPNLDFLDEGVGSGVLDDPAPAARMLVGPRRRRKDMGGQGGVKEIVLSACVGSQSAVNLAFGNERPFTQTMRVRAFQMRFEAAVSATTADAAWDSSDYSHNTSSSTAAPATAFTLSTGTMVIPPGGSEMLTISFSPLERGVYSGVMKVKCFGKSFVLLLRGETVGGVSDTTASAVASASASCEESLSCEQVLLGRLSSPIARPSMPNRIGGCERVVLADMHVDDSVHDMSYTRDESGYDIHDSVTSLEQKQEQRDAAVQHYKGTSPLLDESTLMDHSDVDADVTTEFGLNDLLWTQPPTGVVDEFALQEKWVVSWLRKARGRGYALKKQPRADESADLEGEEKIHYQSRHMAPPCGDFTHGQRTYLSVSPHSLQTAYVCDSQGFPATLEGSVYVHNSSGVELTVGVVTSSEAIHVSTATHRVAGNSSLRIDVTVRHQPFSNPDTPLPPARGAPSSSSSSSSPGDNGDSSDWQNTHVGYIMITDSLGEEFVCEIRRPSTASLLSRVAPSPMLAPREPARASLSRESASTNMADRLVPGHTPLTGGVCPLSFDSSRVSFGKVAVNSLNKRKIVVTNNSTHAAMLTLSDPQLPFVLIDNATVVPAHASVDVFMRFVPVSISAFSSRLSGVVQCAGLEPFPVSLTLSGQAQ